uniref:hypothetical protein n=1 Tax=uncultured Psychrobacter sp. TaxID=259303 RepID=UPI002619E7C5|nr:hypothetical protein [uncultured Psychrobacter sp.]
MVESSGDNLAATFSPELSDLTIYVIDVAEIIEFIIERGMLADRRQGRQIPSKPSYF